MIATIHKLGATVTARIDGSDRPAEIRGHCHKGVDLYDVRTDDGVIHLYLRPDQIVPATALPAVDGPVLRIGSARR